ncbi:DUF7373 family lipoprotein [Mycobacterium kyorinense]|uniref:DUF7373 family lipoprotein n=1 Tax=Mycobacterium kyorinense TaxID=487514 RepID=UPI0009EDEA14
MLSSALFVALVGCSTTTGGVATTPPAPPASSVNASLLDPGRFPTTPQPPAGTAGSEQAGRLAEGHRMANYTVGPWQVDPALNSHLSGDAAVIDTYDQLGQVLWAWVVGGAWGQPFLVGFTSERHSTAGPQKSLRNAVLRFADDRAASAVAQGFHDKAMSFPRLEDVMPIVTEPEQSTPIPGHPDAHGALITYQQGAERLQELIVATAHGPYVLVQVIHCAATPDCPVQLAAHTLDLQLPLIDSFTPTDPSQFATLPLDPTGLVARTLPMPPDQATSTTGAAYEPAGALHFENDPAAVGPALNSAKVDEVSINRATIYRAATPEAAQKLLQAYSDTLSATKGAQSADGVPGLPQSRCTLIPGAGGLIPHHWCLATVEKYMIKTVARQLDTAHQQAAAQYRILVGS